MALVEFEDVGKRYRDKIVLQRADLKLEPGECLALLGHNGAGKTTLIKLTLGLIRPGEGRVRVFGHDPARSAGRGATVGYLPESIALYDNLSGRETLAFYARLKGAGPARNAALLERVGLAGAADRRVKTYSKGMRQRLGLAQALLGAPQLLLLDEPTTGLDPAFRHSFYELLQEALGRGCGVMLSSHALRELEPHIGRAVILHGGRLVAQGSVAELGRAARLGNTIRLVTAPDRAGEVAGRLNLDHGVRHVNGRTVDIECASHEKVALLARIGGLGEGIEDVVVAAPSLDQLFAHFTEREAAS